MPIRRPSVPCRPEPAVGCVRRGSPCLPCRVPYCPRARRRTVTARDRRRGRHELGRAAGRQRGEPLRVEAAAGTASPSTEPSASLRNAGLAIGTMPSACARCATRWGSRSLSSSICSDCFWAWRAVGPGLQRGGLEGDLLHRGVEEQQPDDAGEQDQGHRTRNGIRGAAGAAAGTTGQPGPLDSGLGQAREARCGPVPSMRSCGVPFVVLLVVLAVVVVRWCARAGGAVMRRPPRGRARRRAPGPSGRGGWPRPRRRRPSRRRGSAAAAAGWCSSGTTGRSGGTSARAAGRESCLVSRSSSEW